MTTLGLIKDSVRRVTFLWGARMLKILERIFVTGIIIVLDLFFAFIALALVITAVAWMRQPENRRLLLSCFVPVTVKKVLGVFGLLASVAAIVGVYVWLSRD